MLQITPSKIISEQHDLEVLREEFRLRKSVIIPDFLEVDLLGQIMSVIDRANFVPKIEGKDDDEFGHLLHVPTGQPAVFIFQLLLNRPALFDIVQDITGANSIENFVGRIHRSSVGTDQQIEWHGDNADSRQVGISINLSKSEYSGGMFQIREKGSGRIRNEIGGNRPGDAFLFAISPELQHRLLPIETGGHRTVGVGWFRSLPAWTEFSRTFLMSTNKSCV